MIAEQLVEFISDPLSSKVSILGLWDHHQSISCSILVKNQLYRLELQKFKNLTYDPL